MHRIDTPGNVGGLFVPPDPIHGQVAVLVDSAWLNDLQENVMGVLAGAGIAPVKGDYTQLDAAIDDLIAVATTAGVSSFDGRAGAVVLTAADVDTALGYTPANKAGDTFGGPIVFPWAELDAAAGSNRFFNFTTAGVLRWNIVVDGEAETGANAGSNLYIGRFSDTGAALGQAIAINRATGLVSLQAPTQAVGDDSNQVATTAFVQTASGWTTGDLKWSAINAAQPGWHIADGSAIDPVADPALHAAFGANLPDLRGRFLRALDNMGANGAAGIDPGRAMGSFQADQIRAHQHYNGVLDAGSGNSVMVYGTTMTDVPGAAGHDVHADANAGVPQGLTSSFGGAETHPTNYAAIILIKR